MEKQVDRASDSEAFEEVSSLRPDAWDEMNGGMKIEIRWRAHGVYNDGLRVISIAESWKCQEIHERIAHGIGKPVLGER
jgi:hypothetical protein